MDLTAIVIFSMYILYLGYLFYIVYSEYILEKLCIKGKEIKKGHLQEEKLRYFMKKT